MDRVYIYIYIYILSIEAFCFDTLCFSNFSPLAAVAVTNHTTGMASSLPILTPNTRAEAEAALSYNAMRQSPVTTPKTEDRSTRPSLQNHTPSNYQAAAAVANLSYEPPYPSDKTAEAVRGNLSHGTTQAVLEETADGRDSPGHGESLLRKRESREGARRTSQISADGSRDARPRPYQRQIYNQEDLKRLMTQRLMEDDMDDPDETGYTSAG